MSRKIRVIDVFKQMRQLLFACLCRYVELIMSKLSQIHKGTKFPQIVVDFKGRAWYIYSCKQATPII